MCINPESGNTFTQLVNLTEGGQDERNRDDRTREDSAIVRAEVREIYEQMAEGAVENDDGQRYERELGNAKKLTVKRDDERRARRVAEEDKEQKRPRSKTRRYRSNSNDRRKRRHSTQRRE